MIADGTVIQVSDSALIGAAGTIATAIVTAATILGKMWISYTKERDEKTNAIQVDLAKKMDSWQRESSARETVIREDHKLNNAALLAIAKESVGVQTALVSKLDAVLTNHPNKPKQRGDSCAT